jgi:tetratricopeptide (TPR) repeat protein
MNMKKTFSTCILLFLLALSPSALFADTVLVLPFINEGDKNCAWVGTGLYENSVRELESKGMMVVSPQEVKLACSYLGIYNEAQFNQENIRHIASVLEADRVFISRFTVIAGKISVTSDLYRINEWRFVKKISIADLSVNIFSIQSSLCQAMMTDKPIEYIPAKPVYVTVWKKKKKYIYKKENPYLQPYEWYCRGLTLMEKQPPEALSYLIQTLRSDPEHVGALCAAAEIAHNDQGRIDGALGYLLRADKIMVRRGESSTPPYAAIQLKIADIYEHKNDEVKSQIYISRAFEIWKKYCNNRIVEYGSFLCDLGIMNEEHGYAATAMGYYTMAQREFERPLHRSIRYVWVMKRIGDLYSNSGLSPACEEGYDKARTGFLSKGLDGIAEYADCEFKLGMLYAQRGEKVKAEAELMNAQRIYSNVLQSDKAREARKAADLLYNDSIR